MLFATAYFTATLHTGGSFSFRSHSNIICPKELILTLIMMYNYQASRYSHSLIPLHITLLSLYYPTAHHTILTLIPLHSTPTQISSPPITTLAPLQCPHLHGISTAVCNYSPMTVWPSRLWHYKTLINQKLFTTRHGIKPQKSWIFSNTAVRKTNLLKKIMPGYHVLILYSTDNFESWDLAQIYYHASVL
jgi:hypothetical protein